MLSISQVAQPSSSILLGFHTWWCWRWVFWKDSWKLLLTIVCWTKVLSAFQLFIVYLRKFFGYARKVSNENKGIHVRETEQRLVTFSSFSITKDLAASNLKSNKSSHQVAKRSIRRVYLIFARNISSQHVSVNLTFIYPTLSTSCQVWHPHFHLIFPHWNQQDLNMLRFWLAQPSMSSHRLSKYPECVCRFVQSNERPMGKNSTIQLFTNHEVTYHWF